MENDVQHLIDLLYDMIDNAKGVPLGNDKCIIERNRALDYLDEIRAQLPAELEEAKTDGCPGRILANAKKKRKTCASGRRTTPSTSFPKAKRCRPPASRPRYCPQGGGAYP